MTSSTKYTDPRQALQPISGSSTRTKQNDPRYVPGTSHHHDSMTDEEWFSFMGRPAPTTLVVAPVNPVREVPENPAAYAWKTFREESAKHVMTVLHEDGLYRHIRMAEPGTRMWSWDIVTWPNHLATSGDIADGFTFSRELDMIGFFNLGGGKEAYYSDGAPGIDFRYWAEKLQGDQRDTAREYKHELFVQRVTESLTEDLERGDLTQEQADELITEAREVEENSHAAFEWLQDHDEHFPDSWEWGLRDYTLSFQLACYAVNAAVQAYLEHKAAEDAEAAATEKPGNLTGSPDTKDQQ